MLPITNSKATNGNAYGFTLIELLIVIVIIGILAGIVISVIDPRTTQTKSHFIVTKANVERICLAANACRSTTNYPVLANNAGDCDTFLEIGVLDPTRTGIEPYREAFPDTHSWPISGSNTWGFSGAVFLDSDGSNNPTAGEPACRWSCYYNPNVGQFVFALGTLINSGSPYNTTISSAWTDNCPIP